MTPVVRTWNGLQVPWIAPWSSEQSLPVRLARQHSRQCEDRSDRRDGVLWVRMPATPGTGKPDFAGLHPLRQRQAMTHLLCQVCGTTTVGTREDERHLFLVRDTGDNPLPTCAGAGPPLSSVGPSPGVSPEPSTTPTPSPP